VVYAPSGDRCSCMPLRVITGGGFGPNLLLNAVICCPQQCREVTRTSTQEPMAREGCWGGIKVQGTAQNGSKQSF